MEAQSTDRTLLTKLGDYYLVPHELLHVLAYRLIDKPCHYRLGDRQVQSSARLTRPEDLLVLLLPFGVFFGLGLLSYLAGIVAWAVVLLTTTLPRSTPQAFLMAVPKWLFIFPTLATLFIIYSGTAYCDIRVASRTLFGGDKAKQMFHSL